MEKNEKEPRLYFCLASVPILKKSKGKTLPYLFVCFGFSETI